MTICGRFVSRKFYFARIFFSTWRTCSPPCLQYNTYITQYIIYLHDMDMYIVSWVNDARWDLVGGRVDFLLIKLMMWTVSTARRWHVHWRLNIKRKQRHRRQKEKNRAPLWKGNWKITHKRATHTASTPYKQGLINGGNITLNLRPTSVFVVSILLFSLYIIKWFRSTNKNSKQPQRKVCYNTVYTA